MKKVHVRSLVAAAQHAESSGRDECLESTGQRRLDPDASCKASPCCPDKENRHRSVRVFADPLNMRRTHGKEDRCLVNLFLASYLATVNGQAISSIQPCNAAASAMPKEQNLDMRTAKNSNSAASSRKGFGNPCCPLNADGKMRKLSARKAAFLPCGFQKPSCSSAWQQ